MKLKRLRKKKKLATVKPKKTETKCIHHEWELCTTHGGTKNKLTNTYICNNCKQCKTEVLDIEEIENGLTWNYK